MNAPDPLAGVPGNGGLADESREVMRLWWLLLLGGLVSLAIGIMLLVWPDRTLEVVAILLGIGLLLGGAIGIGLAFAEPSGSRAAALLGAVFAVIVGLIVIRHPSGSLVVIALAVGIYLVVAGILRLVSAFEASIGRGWLLAAALVDIALGVVIVAWPKFGLTTFAVVVGIIMLLHGLLECLAAFALRSAGRAYR